MHTLTHRATFTPIPKKVLEFYCALNSFFQTISLLSAAREQYILLTWTLEAQKHDLENCLFSTLREKPLWKKTSKHLRDFLEAICALFSVSGRQ